MHRSLRTVSAVLALCLLLLPLNAFAKTLKKGSRGDAVTEVQRILIELGYLEDKADGVFGKKTEAAVKAFQQSMGYTADGKLTDEQQDALSFLWMDVEGVMEGDGLDEEELMLIYPNACFTDEEEGTFEYCWRHMDAGRINNLLRIPGLPDKAVLMVTERAYLAWMEGIYRLLDEWEENDPDAAEGQRDAFEEALEERDADLAEALGADSAAAAKEEALWLERFCTDLCSRLNDEEI